MITVDPTNPASLARTLRDLQQRLTALQRSRRVPPPTAKSAAGTGTITPSGSWGGSSPAVDFYVPPSGRVLVVICSQTQGAGPSQIGLGFVMSGANAGSEGDGFLQQFVEGSGSWPMLRQHLVEGLTPGLTTFATQTRRTSGSATLVGSLTTITVVGL